MAQDPLRGDRASSRRNRAEKDRFRQAGLRWARAPTERWDDAGQGLARAAWCLTRHMRPRRVVAGHTSRGRQATLAGLLAELDEIDLFVHDSMHAARNLRFELDHAWASLGISLKTAASGADP